MPVKSVLNSRVPVKIWSAIETVESAALDQLKNIAALPFVWHHVAVMPDVHLGKGATVGSVIATKGAISPAAVGVDIGCGMAARQITNLRAEDLKDLPALRHSIERSIPVSHHGNKTMEKDAESWKGWSDWGSLHPKVQDLRRRAELQLGSLGGGNHFIEVCLDAAGGVWVMLHSGSRNIGKSLAERHIDTAKGMMKKMFISLPDPELAYLALESDEGRSYMRDLYWAQDYAAMNRQIMMERLLKDLSHHTNRPLQVGISVNCHHNFAMLENHFGENVMVTRKGAVRAREGDMGIIPGSMGTQSYIVRGLGNPESFFSCSHGAGRRMSRTEARRRFTAEDLAKQTDGVECRKDDGVVDEIPGAYKDISTVVNDQSDLVTPVATLKQVLCVKG